MECILYQVAYFQLLSQSLPRIVGNSQGQGKRQPEHLANFLQVAVDGMDCSIVLPPLFLQVFGGDDWEEVWSAGT